ncbi:DUF3108 domain-containing protein [Zunongwangia sp. HRR-M8]|uniref:DUF3108 domain-containing protein n=1 Tax=Zunongwangia sp. HRR-M8 TaxID=3015170 RepID=UPI0022DDAC73|nr:DUF3108 domain-containing protein [Zunongwangia sp. HRR-M8]WBL22509.1 DUF3108 domain-containing protein [Zunongwangia sp. HRR-M8]
MIKKLTITIFLFFIALSSHEAQTAYDAGEWFKFRIHYGPFNASYAELQVNEDYLSGTPVYHIVGTGKSTGMMHWFFKVDDNYQTYIDRKTGQPLKFIRKIDEGGHTKDLEIDFDQKSNTAYVHDKKHNKKKTYSTKENIHDMLSAFYYIRSNINEEALKPGYEVHLNLFIDDENMDFKVKFLGRETIKTKFGKVNALKFRPYVMAGRVFKEKESLTFWVSDDKNKVPLKIEANLAVGSLDADLDAYKGLKYPFRIIVD